MNMFQTPDTLQRRPILKPQHPIPRLRLTHPFIPHHRIHKRPLHKRLDQRPRLIRHVPVLFLDCYGGPQPHYNMRDPRRETVGPVVAQDLVIGWVCERDGVFVGEGAGGGAGFCACGDGGSWGGGGWGGDSG